MSVCVRASAVVAETFASGVSAGGAALVVVAPTADARSAVGVPAVNPSGRGDWETSKTVPAIARAIQTTSTTITVMTVVRFILIS